MVHQKGHEKRAGEAGGKARFEGWQGGRHRRVAPVCGRRAARGQRRWGRHAGSLGMRRNNVARPVSDHLRKAIDRLANCSPYVPHQETRDGTH